MGQVNWREYAKSFLLLGLHSYRWTILLCAKIVQNDFFDDWDVQIFADASEDAFCTVAYVMIAGI